MIITRHNKPYTKLKDPGLAFLELKFVITLTFNTVTVLLWYLSFPNYDEEYPVQGS